MIPAKAQRLLVVAIAASSGLACSCMSDLVVANRSDQPVTVILKPERGDSTDANCRCPDGFVHEGFGTTPTADTRQLKRTKWTPLDSTAFKYDSTGPQVTLTITLTLQPQAALRIGDVATNCAGGIIGERTPWQMEIVGPGWNEHWTPGEMRDLFLKEAGGLLVHELRTRGPASPGQLRRS